VAWILDLLQRKPPKLVAVALANKLALIAWKLMVTGKAYAAPRSPITAAGGLEISPGTGRDRPASVSS
jgi:hypothetical protein